MAKKKNKQQPAPPPQDMKPPGTYSRENGILWLNDKFNKDTVYPLIVAIQDYNLMPKGLAPEEIKLYINSPGGEVAWLFPIVNAIRNSSIPVTTIVDGQACSCGIALLMAGHKRIAMDTASLMSHQYSSGAAGKEHELYSRVKSFEMMSDKLVGHYRKYTKKSERYIRKHLMPESDVWLSPDEALKHNIIDMILEP